MYRGDLAFLAIFLLVAGAILWLTPGFPDTGELFGPAFLPRVLAVMLLGLAAGLLLKWLRAATRGRLVRLRTPRGFLARAALLTGAAIGYIALVSRETPLGFPGATLLFLAGTVPLFGGRSPLGIAATAVVVTAGLYLVFRVWLHVPLPRSALF